MDIKRGFYYIPFQGTRHGVVHPLVNPNACSIKRESSESKDILRFKVFAVIGRVEILCR